MIEQELLLLGLLKESPKHGYDIKKEIREILSIFAGVDLKSVYYPLKILEQKGLLIKQSNKQGRRPERFVYQLTAKGQMRFNDLLARSFFDFTRPHFSLDLSLYFLKYIKPDISKRRLRGRMLVLKKLSESLRLMLNSLKKKKSLSLVNILEHNLQMVEAESKFLFNFIKAL